MTKAIVHIVTHFLGGAPRTRCGIWADPMNVTAYPKLSTCARCRKSRSYYRQ